MHLSVAHALITCCTQKNSERDDDESVDEDEDDGDVSPYDIGL